MPPQVFIILKMRLKLMHGQWWKYFALSTPDADPEERLLSDLQNQTFRNYPFLQLIMVHLGLLGFVLTCNQICLLRRRKLKFFKLTPSISMYIRRQSTWQDCSYCSVVQSSHQGMCSDSSPWKANLHWLNQKRKPNRRKTI